MTVTEEKDTPPKPKILPPHGVRIRRRRKQLHLSQDELADIMERYILAHWTGNGEPPKIYKQLIQRVEWGDTKPQALNAWQVEAFAHGLNWTLTQLADALELRLPKGFFEREAYAAPTLFDENITSQTSAQVVLNCYNFIQNTWMTKQVTKSTLPRNATPVNTFVTVIQPPTLAGLELHPQLHDGMIIAFANNVTPGAGDTVFVHDEKADVYGIVTFKPGAGSYAVIALDQSRVASLDAPKVVGVMTAYTNHGSSLIR